MPKRRKKAVFSPHPATIRLTQRADGTSIEIERPCESEEEMDELLDLYEHYIEEVKRLPGWKAVVKEMRQQAKIKSVEEENAQKHAAAKTRHAVRKKKKG